MIIDMLSDTLSRINNGWGRKLSKVSVNNTKLINVCLKLLSEQGCIGKITKIDDRKVEVSLNYDEEGKAPYEKFIKISKCSLRRYTDVKHLAELCKRYPHYMFVVSTSRGVMKAQDAISQHVAGELLFKAIR